MRSRVAGALPIAAISSLLALCVPLSSSQAAPIKQWPLSNYAGKWEGLGWVKRHASAERESVRCRLTARYGKNSRKLSMNGKCAAAARTFTLLGHIAGNPETNEMTGRWVNPDGVGSLNISGKRRVNSATFEFKAKDRKSGERQSFRTSWGFGKVGFSIRSQQLTPQTSEIGAISFERRE